MDADNRRVAFKILKVKFKSIVFRELYNRFDQKDYMIELSYHSIADRTVQKLLLMSHPLCNTIEIILNSLPMGKRLERMIMMMFFFSLLQFSL